MSRKAGIIFLLAALVGGEPPIVLAEGVVASPHDLAGQGYVVTDQPAGADPCSFCHPPLLRRGQEISRGERTIVNEFGQTNLLCFSCHDGLTIVSPHVDAANTAFHPASHGMADISGLPDGDVMDVYLAGKQKADRVSCVSCHQPHNNAIRPFLERPWPILCSPCHQNRVNSGTGVTNLEGTHPVGILPFDTAGGPSPIEVQSPFKGVLPKSYPSTDGRLALTDIHWTLNGHLEDGDRGKILCLTCHAVHGTDNRPPVKSFLVLPVSGINSSPVCEGCHRGKRGDGLTEPPYPNPGGTLTTRTYHPCDDDVGNGTGWSVPVTIPEGWPTIAATRTEPELLVCLTCHKPHGAWGRTPILRDPVDRDGFCEICHQTPPHPHSSMEITGELDCITTHDEDAHHLGKPVDGIGCASCHRAHNAGYGKNESRYIPLLREPARSSAVCYLCHPEDNPTCASEGYEASHFLGDPTSTDTYDKLEPTEKEDIWPQTGLFSLYGGENGKEVICQSCHSFEPKALVSGDHDTDYLLAPAGRDKEWTIGLPDEYLCTGCHGEAPATVGEGVTHPLMEIDGILPNGDLIPLESTEPIAYTINRRINCETCHLAHNAPREGGYYILRIVDGSNTDPKTIHPPISSTGLCVKCHQER